MKKIEPVKPWLQRFSFPFPSLGDTAQTASYTAVEVMWLRDLLPNFVPNARIASYSYKSGWRKNIKTSLRECAEQFLNTLHQNRSNDEVGSGVVNSAKLIANNKHIGEATAAHNHWAQPWRGGGEEC